MTFNSAAVEAERGETTLLAGEAGFSLVEVMVATMLLAVSIVSVAQLFAVATKKNFDAKTTTVATVAAQQKMEQLRSLTWGFDPAGIPVSDFTTDTTVPVPRSTGGKGLSPSPGNTLAANVPDYVDYVDRWGNVLGGGAEPPADTQYVRRWSIDALPANPGNTLVLQVFVFRVGGRAENLPDAPVARFPEEARLTTVKTRKAL